MTTEYDDDKPAEEPERESGEEEVDERLSEEQAKGYVGHVPDEKPNEEYTVSGVTQDDPNVVEKDSEEG